MAEPVFSLTFSEASRGRARKREAILEALSDAVFMSLDNGKGGKMGPGASCLPYLRQAQSLLAELIDEIAGGSNG